MKKINYLFTLMAGMALMSGCLKDKVNLDPELSNNVIEFKNVATIVSPITAKLPLYILAFDKAGDLPIPITVSYSGPEASAPNDITVTLAVDNALVTAYNTDQSTAYEALPSALFTPVLSLVIPKGQRTATANFVLKTALFDLSKLYALGLKITQTSSGVISKNFSSIVINTIAKNKYDGTYKYTTSANTSLQPNKNTTTVLETVGENRIQMKPGLLDTYSNLCFYNIDPVTNQITVECPSLRVQEPQDLRSKYNPATKTLTVFWKQGNGGRTFEEVMVYTGPR